MSDIQTPAVVIDNGSWTIKAGVAGDNEPRAVIPTLAGSSKGAKGSEVSVGQNVRDNYNDVNPRWAFGNSACADWGDMTSLWRHAYDTLKIDPASTNVLTTVAVCTPNKDREKMLEVFFESFNVPGCYVAYSSVLALYACGRLSGTVVDCGHAATHIVPIYEGFMIRENVAKMPIGGNSLTEYLGSLMSKKGIDMPTPYMKVFDVTKIKEALCRTALNFDEENKAASAEKYALPDGRNIELDTEPLQCPELYFQPRLRDPTGESRGLPKWIHELVMKCEPDVRSDLLKNIVTSGGASMVSGFPERLQKEMEALNKMSKVIVHKDRNLFPFIGASVLSGLDDMSSQWITKKEFQESGSGIVNTKCR